MMKVITATVQNGRIEVPRGEIEDGTSVTILAPEAESSFTLSPQEVEKLQISIDQASRGQVVDGWQLLRDLQA